MSRIIVDFDLCTGCGACLPSCLYGALSCDDCGATVNLDKCSLCGACVSECPFSAISIEGERGEHADLADYHGIWVFAEQWDGEINEVAFELLTVARNLAGELGEELSAVLLGHNIAEGAKHLISYGAQHVYLLDDTALQAPDDATYAYLFAKLIKQHKPAVVLYGATAFGRSLAPRVAAKLNTGLTADCTMLAIDQERKLLLQTRPAFGGNIMATILCPQHRPQMATVRPKVFKKEMLDNAHGDIIDTSVDLSSFIAKSRVVDIVELVSKELRVEDAEIVVSGGAGFRSQEQFALVQELADLLGGCVGASRAAVDLGFAEHSRQVGQTGKVIAPKLYIACGIAGAIQHMVGMEHAETIIAINNDPDAPIFQIADIGIVGDLMEVLPQLIASLKERRGLVSA